MVPIAPILSLAEEDKFMIWIIIVSVLRIITGVARAVLFLLVLVVKFGKEQDVCALQEKTLMGICVYNASMDKYGTLSIKNVLVKMVINGIVSTVKELILVQVIEFGTQHISNVFANNLRSGVAMHVYLSLNVVEDNIGMQF